MDPALRDAFAQRLQRARTERQDIERLTLERAELSTDEAYGIQEAGVRLRLSSGERQVGLKMGLTSAAKRAQMSLASPVYGVLTDRMELADGATLSLATGIHARIEPEIAFRLRQPLRGVVTLEQAAEACEGVAAAMEVIDSRYRNFKYFSLPDVIADNASSFMFVLGRFRPLAGLPLDQLEMRMAINGTVAQSARSDDISGHPLSSLVQLAGLLSARGQEVPAGSVVLAGAATAAVALDDGDRVELQVSGLEPVRLLARG